MTTMLRGRRLATCLLAAQIAKPIFRTGPMSFFSSASAAVHNEGSMFRNLHGTTVLCVRKGNEVVMAADGQVTMGNIVLKPNARKIRILGSKRDVVVGFAGSTADALTLYEKLEEKIAEHPGQLMRSCVELAKMWRQDKFLRRLEAIILVADRHIGLTITGQGDVFEPIDGIMGIGSGGAYATAAARALVDVPGISAEDVVRRSMKIAADLCIYTNSHLSLEKITAENGPTERESASDAS